MWAAPLPHGSPHTQTNLSRARACSRRVHRSNWHLQTRTRARAVLPAKLTGKCVRRPCQPTLSGRPPRRAPRLKRHWATFRHRSCYSTSRVRPYPVPPTSPHVSAHTPRKPPTAVRAGECRVEMMMSGAGSEVLWSGVMCECKGVLRFDLRGSRYHSICCELHSLAIWTGFHRIWPLQNMAQTCER